MIRRNDWCCQTCGRYMGQEAWFQEYPATWGQTRICHYARFSSKVEDVQSKGAGEDVQGKVDADGAGEDVLGKIDAKSEVEGE